MKNENSHSGMRVVLRIGRVVLVLWSLQFSIQRWKGRGISDAGVVITSRSSQQAIVVGGRVHADMNLDVH